MSGLNVQNLQDHATAARTLVIFDELAAALRALNAAQTTAIVLKGAALARTVYPNIAGRPMVDADLLVRRQDGERAQAALEAAGFGVQADWRRRFGLSTTAFATELAVSRTPLMQIEVHWNLTASQWLLRPSALDVETLFAAAQPLAIADVDTLQLSPADTLLHLCLHMVAHGFAHPPGYVDIAHVLAHYEPFPWDEFVARARRFRLSAVCYFPLDASASTLALPVPGTVLDALRPPPWQRRLVQAIADPRRLLAGESDQLDARISLLSLAAADRPLDALRTVGWFFFPGPRHLAGCYGLDGAFPPLLACVWHPFLVVWRALAGAVALGGRG